MSGGSYDYLCTKDGFEINYHRDQLANMRDRLISLGYVDAAKETESCLLMLQAMEVRLQARIDRLSPVWKAIEWCDSGDWRKDDIEQAIEKYRNL